MQHFFVTPDQVTGKNIRIEGMDVNHIRNVLRMREGDELLVSDGNNHKYRCRIEECAQAVITARIEKEESVDTELSSEIYLFQGLPKSDKMELIIQKAVELGVCGIVPVMTRRCVVKLDAEKSARKIERWREIAKSAAKQSGRGIVPRVEDVLTYPESLKRAGMLDVILIPYELSEGMKETKAIIEAIRPGQSVGIFIGPEGGFEKEEVFQAVHAGAREITLGRRILRTETAGLAALSILMYHLEIETA